MLARIGGRRLVANFGLVRAMCDAAPFAAERDINTRIRIVLGKRHIRPFEIDGVLKEHKDQMTVFNIAFFYSQISKYKLRLSDKQLSATATILKSKKEFLLPKDAAIILFAMQLYNNESSAKLVVDAVRCKITTHAIQPFRSRDIALTLYGLRNMNNRSQVVCNLLRIVQPHIVSCPDEMTTADLSSAFFGLRSMNTVSTPGCVVANTLDALCAKLESCSGDWKMWELGNAVSGLQRMNGEHASVRRVLSSFYDILDHTDALLDSRAAGNMLLGLQSMSSNIAEVRQLVQLIADKIDLSAADRYDAIAVKNSLGSLRHMHSQHEEVRHLVAKLSRKILQTQETIPPRQLSAAMCGLRHMSSDSAEVRELVSVLSDKLQEMMTIGGLTMNTREVSQVFMGITNLRSEESEVRKLLVIIDNVLERAQYDDLSTSYVVEIIAGMESLSPTCPEVRTVVGKVAVLARATSSKRAFNEAEICRLIRGLRRMDSTGSEEVKDLLRAVTDMSRSVSTSAGGADFIRRTFLKEFDSDRITRGPGEDGVLSSVEEEIESWISVLGLNSHFTSVRV